MSKLYQDPQKQGINGGGGAKNPNALSAPKASLEEQQTPSNNQYVQSTRDQLVQRWNDGIQAGKDSRHLDAVKIYQTCLDLNPTREDRLTLNENIAASYNNAGNQLLNSKKYREAITLYHNSLEYSVPGAPLVATAKGNILNAYDNLGHDYIRAKKFDACLKMVDEATVVVDKLKVSATPLEKLKDECLLTKYWDAATACNEAKDYLGGVALYKKCLECNPSDKDKETLGRNIFGNYFNAGNKLVSEENFDRAINVFQEGLRLSSLSEDQRREMKGSIVEAYKVWGHDKIKRGQFNEALGLAEKGQQYAETAAERNSLKRVVFWAHHNNAAELNEKGQYAEAKVALQNATRSAPTEGELFDTRLLLGGVQRNFGIELVRDKKFERAEEEFNGALAIYNDLRQSTSDKDALNRVLQSREDASLLLASMYSDKGDFDRAHEINSSVLRESPQSPQAQRGFAVCCNKWAVELMKEKRYDAAILHLRQGLVVDDKDPFLRKNLAIGLNNHAIQCEERHEYDRAALYLEEAVRTGVGNQEIYRSNLKSLRDFKQGLISKLPDPQEDLNFSVDTFKQQQIGDCWLLAGLNAVSNTSVGRRMLATSIKTAATDDQGKPTEFAITLFSRPATSDQAITPLVYKVTLAEVQQESSTNRISAQDLEPRLFEMAVKKYRGGGANALSSGQNGEGMEILTGRKSTVSTTPKEMVESLEKLARNPSNTAGVFSFKEGFNDEPRILDRHAFSVRSVDLVSGRVAYCNPWDTSKTYSMGFDEFTRKCDEIALLSFGG